MCGLQTVIALLALGLLASATHARAKILYSITVVFMEVCILLCFKAHEAFIFTLKHTLLRRLIL